MKMIAKLTRQQLEALAFTSLMVLLSAISVLFDVPAGVKSDLSAMAPQQVTTSTAEARRISVNW